MRVSIKPFSSGKKLNEIYQSVGLQFAFVSDKNEQCHDFVRCRDFLQDVLRGMLSNTRFYIYGFIYDPDKNPHPSKEKTRMLVKADGFQPATYGKMRDVLRIVEKEFRIRPRTRFFRTDLESTTYLFESSEEWSSSPFMISLYTFLMRFSVKELNYGSFEELKTSLKFFETRKGNGDNDISYLNDATTEKMFRLLKERKELPFEKDSEFITRDINTYHNASGIVAYCKAVTVDSKINSVISKIFANENQKKVS